MGVMGLVERGCFDIDGCDVHNRDVVVVVVVYDLFTRELSDSTPFLLLVLVIPVVVYLRAMDDIMVNIFNLFPWLVIQNKLMLYRKTRVFWLWFCLPSEFPVERAKKEGRKDRSKNNGLGDMITWDNMVEVDMGGMTWTSTISTTYPPTYFPSLHEITNEGREQDNRGTSHFTQPH